MGHPCLLQNGDDDLGNSLVCQNSNLYGLRSKVIQEHLERPADRLGSDWVGLYHPLSGLNGQGGDAGDPIESMGGYRLEIGRNSGSGRRVKTGYGEDNCRAVAHTRNSTRRSVSEFTRLILLT